MEYRTKQRIKESLIGRNVIKLILKVNHLLFWWYYKRVPVFFHKWTILKSIRLLVSNYEHEQFRYKGLNKVLSGAIKREKEMISEISNLKLRLMNVPHQKIDQMNKIFGTNLKGKSKFESEN